MQLIPRYLVNNRIEVLLDRTGFSTEYRPVYSRTVSIYKGIDNALEFKLVNADQKPIDITSYTPKFQAYDEDGNLVIAHDGVSLQDSTRATQGLFKVTVEENDLLNIPSQFLKYNIYLQDGNGDTVLTYSKSHFENEGIIHVKSDAFPSPRDSYQVVSYSETGVGTNIWTSEAIDAQPGINGNEALHTVALYTNGFAGTVTIQATLDNQVVFDTDWADITNVVLTGSETEPTAINFNGVFKFIRIHVDSEPASTITKTLIRN